MRSPFPGMDPYLEQPAIWSSVHSRLIVAIADAIAPQILPTYYVEVETRTYSRFHLSEVRFVRYSGRGFAPPAVPHKPEKCRIWRRSIEQS